MNDVSGVKISTVLDKYRGVGPGFDFLRLSLAVFIFYAHTKFVLGTFDTAGLFQDTPMTPGATAPTPVALPILSEIKARLYVLAVPMFFALSGFLVTGSALRLGSVPRFLGFRVLRILPALMVEICLSAFLLGILFSDLSLREYLSSSVFWRYFGNIIGVNWFWLPGVFAHNPSPLVNANLWTLPAEFYCYLIMAVLMGTGMVSRRKLFLYGFGVLSVVLIAASLGTGYGVRPSVWSIPAIVYCFFAGVVFFQWREKIPLNRVWFVISVLMVILTFRTARFCFLVPIPLTYIVVYLGCIARLALPFLKGRDYSYGVYLYGFPITQAIVATFPGISRLALFPTALTVTLLFAALSWHWIEKPFLRLKR